MPHNVNEADIEALTIYDISVLAFTSPETITEGSLKNINLTSKDAYVWAGVIAYILSERPSLEKEQILNTVRASIKKNYSLFSSAAFSIRNKLQVKDLDIRIVQTFLNELEFSSANLQSIIERADDARIKLEALGMIWDPFKKEFLGIQLGVISILPVSFTAKTDKGVKVETLIRQYVQKNAGNKTDWHLKGKVIEIATAFVDELIPTIMHIIDEMTKGEKGIKP